jgi:trans-2,3-dihydro-3-hydroxyanthranilate isomerase
MCPARRRAKTRVVTTSYSYRIVDVFTDAVLEGNPLAVVPDARGIDDATMQRLAREFNLSETVFVLPPKAPKHAATLRIFTPTMEMRFAGHPTVGASAVLLALGVVAADCEAFIVEELIGEVPVRVDRTCDPVKFWLTTPPIEFGRHFDPELCARVLGLAAADLLGPVPQRLSAGNPNIYVALRDREAVDRAWIDLAGVRDLHGGVASTDCIFVFAPTNAGAYSRMFAPEHGVIEDPATGSATGPLAAYMMHHGLAASRSGTTFVSEQGVKMGRRSMLHVAVHGEGGSEGIEVGGSVVEFARGTIAVPSPVHA